METPPYDSSVGPNETGDELHRDADGRLLALHEASSDKQRRAIIARTIVTVSRQSVNKKAIETLTTELL